MASERERQKRLERKRRRRREKRRQRAPRDAPLIVSFGTGLPKMSETLITFADPLLSRVPETEADWRSALSVAALVWNGIVAEVPRDEVVARLRRGFDPSVDVGELVRYLTERKRTLFPDDLRFILDVRTERSGDRVHVTAAGMLAR